MQMHSWKLIVGAACLVGLGACSDLTNPVNQSAAGTYALVTVNGNNLPFTYSQGGTTVTIQSDTYALNNDGTYSELTDETISNGFQTQEVAETETGFWSQDNNALYFRPSSSTQGYVNSYTGSLTGGGILGGGTTLTLQVNGIVSVYQMR